MSDFTSDTPTSSVADLTKRVRYSTGLVLGSDEFNQDQAYFMERDRLLTRALHGYGVVQGLRVHVEAPNADSGDKATQIRVEPGLAIDPSGQHVCIDRPQCAVLRDWLARQDPSTVFPSYDAGSETGTNGNGGSGGGSTAPDVEPKEVCISVVLRYGTCATDFVPIPGEPCRSAEESKAASRLADDFHLALEFDDDRPPQVEEHAVRLLGRLLRALEVRPSGPYVLGEGPDLDALLMALPAVLSPANTPAEASLPDVEEEAGVALPTDENGHPLLPVQPGRETAVLRTIEEVWTTRARRALLEIGHDEDDPLAAGQGTGGRCQPVPKGDDGIVLGTLCLDVTPMEPQGANGSIGLKPAPDARTDDGHLDTSTLQVSTKDRPGLLASRVLQETGLFDRMEPGSDGREELGPAAGDLEGTYPNLTVAKLQGETLSVDPDEGNVTLKSGDVLTYDGTKWHPDSFSLNDLKDVSAETPRETDHLLGIDADEDPETWTPIPVSEVTATNAQPGLTRVVATSWGHEDVYTRVNSLDLELREVQVEAPVGLAVAFGTREPELRGEKKLTNDGPGTVLVRTLTQETFRVFVEGSITNLPLKRRERLVPREILPLTTVNLQGRHIMGGVVNRDAERARGVAFLMPLPADMRSVYDRAVGSSSRIRLDVEVRGSYLLDENERAVDAEFVRMDLPTGDRPADSDVGVQGGDFESWVYFEAGETLTFDLNADDLSVEQLMELPGVGEAYAERILDYLAENRPIASPLDLTEVPGITEELIEEEWGNRVEATQS